MTAGDEGYSRLKADVAARGVDVETVKERLKLQTVELPSWAVGNSGTRYGVFRDPGAARHVWDRIDDCAEIQRHVGICPAMATSVVWDVADDGNYEPVRAYAAEHGLRIGTVHPNAFMGQQFRFGSVCAPDEQVRGSASEHFVDCVRIARELGSNVLGIWLADGTNYPGQDGLRARKHRLREGMTPLYEALDPGMTLLVEYKFFEPSFYTTDLMDWGMSLLLCTQLGEQAKVLVDIGHHPQGANVEHIVSILLDEGRMGGFHLNARRYADDDLIAGSTNPLELFLIYDQIVDASLDEATRATAEGIVTMLDQSHNVEPSIEGIIQSIVNVQTAYAKALLVDRPALASAQAESDVLLANRTLMSAFETDVRTLLRRVHEEMGLAPDPLASYRGSGYAAKIAAERTDAGAGTLGG
jgi:L-rhamnose isomerase/sugar isomerase